MKKEKDEPPGPVREQGKGVRAPAIARRKEKPDASEGRVKRHHELRHGMPVTTAKQSQHGDVASTAQAETPDGQRRSIRAATPGLGQQRSAAI